MVFNKIICNNTYFKKRVDILQKSAEERYRFQRDNKSYINYLHKTTLIRNTDIHIKFQSIKMQKKIS